MSSDLSPSQLQAQITPEIKEFSELVVIVDKTLNRIEESKPNKLTEDIQQTYLSIRQQICHFEQRVLGSSMTDKKIREYCGLLDSLRNSAEGRYNKITRGLK